MLKPEFEVNAGTEYRKQIGQPTGGCHEAWAYQTHQRRASSDMQLLVAAIRAFLQSVDVTTTP